ncbi:MAG: hypothetical protein PHN84_07885 [Desulfuromonadaceae bacterium]|nr:hypothetical protein [Desulfuromonadaceae bacterium]MDD2854751.1 hypothetical protein [Desulfuromonadaceae bacterium]
MKIDRMAGQIEFDSTEELLDSFVSLSIQLNDFGNETYNSLVDDPWYFKGRKLLWESGFALRQQLRHELLSALPQKRIVLHI